MRVRRLHDLEVSPMGLRQIGEAGHAETGQSSFVGGPVQEAVDDGYDLGAGDFPLTAEDMASALDPAKYVGRCAEQVDAFLKRIAPLLEGAADVGSDISL